MKLYLFVVSSFIFLYSYYFSFWENLVNIYKQVNNNYKNETNQSFNYALQKVAKYFNTDPDTMKWILEWNLTLCSKTNLIKDKKQIGFDEFNKCYFKIVNKLNEIQSSKIMEDILDKSYKKLDMYANNNTDDSPYDLAKDINNISKLLFKEKLPSLKSRWKINMKQENINSQKNNSYNPDNILQNFEGLTNTKNTSNNLNNSKDLNTKNTQNKNNYQNANNPIKHTNFSNNQTKKTSKLSENSKNNFTNPNFQIWNICSNTTNNNQSQNQNNTNNLEQKQFFSTWWEEYKNQFPSDFQTFIWWWEKASFITPKWWENSINSIFSGNLNPNINNKLKQSLKNGNPLCSVWENQILSVCIKLIPSWPRWPVWWTTWANSIEKVIDKIEDTLKDIRAHWIIPSAHWDEALDIDYKHVKLADILSFNIVLTKKPVFKYAPKDKKVEKTKKDPPQACPNTPWNLANLYTELWIKNCSSKQADTNKYLIDISENDKKIQEKWRSMVQWKIWTENTTIPMWTNKEEDRYNDLVTLLINWFKNLDNLLSSWQNASATLKAKSE